MKNRYGGTYVFGYLRLRTRSVERAFFVYIQPRRWNVYVSVVHVQRISNSRPSANFQCTIGAFNSNFRIRQNVHFSKHNLKSPQQLGISFIDCRISFVRIVDFFYILYFFLKNCKFVASTLPIFHSLSSNTYPLEPIL